MKKSINRFVCFFLIAITAFVFLPFRFSGSAALANLQMQFKISRLTGDLTIISVTGEADQYELPDTLQGHRVVALGQDAFTRVNGLTKLTIPASVKTIEARAVGYNIRGKTDGFVIVGYGGSAAETYAKNNRIDFVDLAGPAVELEGADVPFSSPSGFLTTGLTGRHVMSKREIINTMKDIPASSIQNLYAAMPSSHAPYQAGAVSQLSKNVTLQRLNLYRALAGLNPVRYETEYEPYCQRGAVVMAANNLMTHYPSKPYDMDKDFFDVGYYGTSHSNIARLGSVEPKLDPLLKCVDMWIADSDNNNIGALGHRRWFLNPGMGGTAFGSAQGQNNTIFTAAYSVDNSAPVDDYELIAWPPSGYVPSDDRIFDSSTAWSVSLNPQKYLKPDGSARAKITRDADGKTFSFSSGGSNGFFTVENSGYGVDNCIIFRPDGLGVPKGRYTVEISGVKTRSGSAVTLKYAVEFFATVGVEVPDKPLVVTTTERPSQIVTTTEKPSHIVTTTEKPSQIATTTSPYTFVSETIRDFPTIPTTGNRPSAPTTTEKTDSDNPTLPTRPWLPDDPTVTDATEEPPTAAVTTTVPPTTVPPIPAFDLASLLRFKSGSGIYYDEAAGVISAPQKLTYQEFFDAFETPQNVRLSDGDAAAPVVTGAEFVYTDGDGNRQSMPIAVRGDADGDGRIKASDARCALRVAAKLDVLDPVKYYAADVDRSGKINSGDARTILRVAAKLQEELPAAG